jgi:hypothetical protein
MALSPLKTDIEYFPDKETGRPIAFGKVYIGIKDLDPEDLVNRVPVTVIKEDGTQIIIDPTAQPLTTNMGGQIAYGGSPVVVNVDGVYSVKVLDNNNKQKLYVPISNEFTASAVQSNGSIPDNATFSIESATAGKPASWNIQESTNGVIATSEDSAHGLSSLKFTSIDATGSGTATSNKFDVLAGGNVGIRFSYKSTAINTLNKIDINWYTFSGTLISFSSVLNENIANPTAYTTYVKSVTAPPQAVRADLVLNGVDGAGTVVIGSTYFDAFDIQTNSAAVSFNGVERLANKTYVDAVFEGPQTGLEGPLKGNADTATNATFANAWDGDRLVELQGDVLGSSTGSDGNHVFTATIGNAKVTSLKLADDAVKVSKFDFNPLTVVSNPVG